MDELRKENRLLKDKIRELEETVMPASVSIIEYNAFAGIRPTTRKIKVVLLGNSMYPKELPDNIVIEHRNKYEESK